MPPPADRDVHLARVPGEHVARAAQFGEQFRIALVHRRVDLDHALRDLGLQLAAGRIARGAAQQVVRVGREVEVARVHQHQLELDAEGERLRKT